MTRMFRTNITRRFDLGIADEIERLESEIRADPDAPFAARDVFLTALLICDEDGAFTMPDTLAAATWMTQQGRLTWERGDDETIVRSEERLN